METVRFGAASNSLSKALDVNSQADVWNSQETPFSPNFSVRSSAPTENATFDMRGVASMFVMPFCDGPAGSRFAMRVMGWRSTEGTANTLVWVPYFLAQMNCIACNRHGPVDGKGANLAGRKLAANERLCDVIVGRGAVRVYSAGRGTNLPASAYVTLGCQKVSFDFKQIDKVSMNCFYAPA